MKRTLIILLLLPVFVRAQIITTVAGNGYPGNNGDGGPATNAYLHNPHHVAFDLAGNMYIADQDNVVVRKVSTTGIISRYAGTLSSGGFSGDGGPATAAKFSTIESIAFDGAGNLYVTDGGNARLRKVDASGTISTVAGNGTIVYSGDGGPATAASMQQPNTVVVDGSGNIYVTDFLSDCVRKINASGIISTIAGNGTGGFSGDGGQATAATLDGPVGIAIDAGGNIYIMDGINRRIRKIDPSGIITTVAGNGSGGYTGDGGPATAATLSDQCQGITLDNAGNVYVADMLNYVIRKVNIASGIITTVAGSGVSGTSGDSGPATACKFKGPAHIAFDGSGNAYVSDFSGHKVRKISSFVAVPDISSATGPTVVYPNPTTSILNIESASRISGTVISNIAGQIVYTGHHNARIVQIEVAYLAKGVYFIRINDNDLRMFVKE